MRKVARRRRLFIYHVIIRRTKKKVINRFVRRNRALNPRDTMYYKLITDINYRENRSFIMKVEGHY